MGKLAVVLSGGWARAAGHLGTLLALEQAGIKPDIIVGTAGGALAGALYWANDGQAQRAKDEYYRVVQAHSWQELVGVDLAQIVAALDQPSDLHGFLSGRGLFDALREQTAVGQRGFHHLGGELFVLTSDLISGRECVFCAQTQDQLFPGDPPAFTLFAQSEENLNDANVATAVWASMVIPPLFTPVALRGKHLVSGEPLVRRAAQLALALPEVDRVLLHHVGYASKLRDDFAQLGVGVLTLESHALAAEQQFLGLLEAVGTSGVPIRLLDPGLVTTSEVDISKTQELVESARRTTAAILEKGDLFGDPKKLAKALQDEQGRWHTQVSGKAILIRDQKAPVVEEMAWDFEEYLEKIGETRLRERWPVSTNEWLWEQARSRLGGKLWTLLFKKWLRLSYDYAIESLKEVVALPPVQKGVHAIDDAMVNGTVWFLDHVLGPIGRLRK